MKFTVSDAHSSWMARICVRGTRLSTYPQQATGLTGLQDVSASGWQALNHDIPLPACFMRRQNYAEHRCRFVVHGYPYGLRVLGCLISRRLGALRDRQHDRLQAKIWRTLKAPSGPGASFY